MGVGVFGATDTPIPDKLGMNRPNPFNPRTVIPFDVSHRSAVSLRIYSTAGRLLRDLVSGIRVPGRYEAEWDGRDDQGTTLPSGVYFIELRMDGKRVGSRKLLLLR